MLLFLDDWKLYPEAIIDLKTKNESFIRISALYKEMGIRNHAFPLALINPELQGVDPFDPNLSLETMTAIVIECKLNYMYYLREIAIVPGSTYEIIIRFKANRANIALAWLFYNHITNIVVQPRQTGKSFSIDELMFYHLNLRCTSTEINLLTKDDTLRASNLERLKKIEAELPFYLKQRNRLDVGNTEEMSVKSLGNMYRGHLPNKSPKAALNVGRGLTSPIFEVDEAAFFYNIAISLPAAFAAGTAARNLAKLKNEPYGNILSTTAGKLDDPDGAYIYSLLVNSATWSEKFLDCQNREELEEVIRKNSPKGELRVNSTFNHRQLGYTDAWLKEAIENSTAVGEAADRDFFNKWTSGSQQSPLPVHLNELIRKSEADSYFDEISIYGYIVRWYIPEDRIQQYMNNNQTIMSIDSSDAAGGDDITLMIRSVKTGEVIAAGNFNETNLIIFCEWLVTWFTKFANFTLIIERRSTGAMILDYLLLMLSTYDIDPFKRIYNKIVQNSDEEPELFAQINKPVYARTRDLIITYKKYFGFATSGVGVTSRSDLYGTTLLNSAKITGDKVKDKRTIDQILGLTIRNGRVDHPVGGNDDLCIAWLLGYWLLSQGKNLSFYGINSREILSENIKNREVNNPVDIYNSLEQDRIKQRIEQLAEQLKNERDSFIAYRLETELRNQAEKLDTTDRNRLSVDDLINSLREHRAVTNRNKLFSFR